MEDKRNPLEDSDWWAEEEELPFMEWWNKFPHMRYCNLVLPPPVKFDVKRRGKKI